MIQVISYYYNGIQYAGSEELFNTIDNARNKIAAQHEANSPTKIELHYKIIKNEKY